MPDNETEKKKLATYNELQRKFCVGGPRQRTRIGLPGHVRGQLM